jgi:alpha-D-xyloside xylohydrolase
MKRVAVFSSLKTVLNWHRLSLLLLVIAGLLGANTVMAYSVTSAQKVDDGVEYSMNDGSKMKLQVCTDKIIRVVYTKNASFPPADSNYVVVKKSWPATSFTYNTDDYSIQAGALKVTVAKETGAVSFYNGSTLILKETAGKILTSKTIRGKAALEGTIAFNSDENEGIYGFGQFQNGLLNQKGLDLDLEQLNISDCSPMFLSTRGFGVLLVDYSNIKVTPPLTIKSAWATNDVIDYYFMYGPEFDDVIAAYRTITGPAPLWPKWAYGYWQCKNLYKNQQDILTAVKTFRSKGYPIDNVVQDWAYYPSNGNGCQCFDASRYPNITQLIKTLHDSLNCHFTISVWPSFNPLSGANYDFMNSRNYLLNSKDFLGKTYDAFNDSAAYYYWKFINDSLVSKDVDAFWPDATEPEYHNDWSIATTSLGPSDKVMNLFPLLHSKNLHDGFRASPNSKGKRVCNLTRSYFAGSQRLGAGYWTGDVETNFNTYVTQIPAGLNVCMTGLPLFCTDIGGFKGIPNSPTLTRWFEWGVFNPIFRIHGSRDTELWLDPQSASEATLVKYLKLRYRLFPYVYSLAWKVTSEGYTMMRALPFDFRTDANVTNINNEFMFGPALLIAPVTVANANSRSVYLPAGAWYDFYTGKVSEGGKNIANVDAPLEKIPVFVRAGSILPLGPEITYADTAADPIELRVYTGADGKFTIYEDEGDKYDYEKGAYATIPIEWNEASGNLKIGPRSGSFPGMLAKRTFNVVWVSENHGNDGTVTPAASIDKVITFEGGAVTLNKATGNIGVITSKITGSKSSFSAGLHGNSYVVSVKGNDAVQVRICDLGGRTIASRMIAGNSSLAVLQRMPAGIYFVQFRQGNNKVTRSSILLP